jgi:aromatic-L-amino-acid/L-tryptophan decarboxylase
VNDTPLPVVCFVDPAHDAPRWHEAIVRAVIASGAAWLSVTRLASGARAIRACVTSHRTGSDEVDALVDALEAARGAL